MKTLTYEEIVSQNQEGVPSAAQLAAERRQGRRILGAAGDAGTRAAPREVRACAMEIAAARMTLAVPAASASALGQIDQITDSNIDYVAPVVAGLLRDVPKVGQATQVSAEALFRLEEQRTEMTELRETTAKVRSDLMKERRRSAARVRELCQGILSEVRSRLEPGRLPRDQVDQLRSDAAEILDLMQQIEQAPLRERERTLTQQAAHEALLDEGERRKKLLSAMLALRRGEEIEESAWDEAVEIYDQLISSDEQAGRRRRRR